MPVYEYQCGACGHEFEEWQKITDPRIKTCPKCSKDSVERLISQTAFQLKGGGWYKDLYSSSKGASSSTDGGANGKSESKSDGAASKTESKPETKSESKSSDTSKSGGSTSTPSSGGSTPSK